MPHTDQVIQCPIQGPVPFTACPDDEVTPLVEFLRSNSPVVEPVTFPRGTLLPDGRLDLCKQNLGPDGCRRIVQALGRNQHVKSLLLGTDGIGDEGASSVGKLIESNPSLQIVYLGCNGVTETGTKSLVDSLLSNSSVEGLWLKRNPIGDQGAEEIARLLRCNQTLRVLDLVNTGFASRGIEAICASLQTANCSVERLYLGGNALNAHLAPSLADVLRVNVRLKSLLLNVGQLGDEGVGILAEGLAANRTLCELGLASNGITTRGLKPLMDTVKSHPTLERLDLGYSPSTKVLGARANSFGDDDDDHGGGGGRLIASMVRANTTLKSIKLSKTGIGIEGRKEIESSLLSSRSVQHCSIDGGLSPSVQSHLIANRENAGDSHHPSSDVRLIRSVYRTAK